MANFFTATNNHIVKVDKYGDVRIYGDGVNLDDYNPLNEGDLLALREFFAYQDTVKPHHSAQVGEVWDLDSTQGTTVRVLTVDDGGDVLFVAHDLNYYDLTDPVFTGGVKVA